MNTPFEEINKDFIIDFTLYFSLINFYIDLDVISKNLTKNENVNKTTLEEYKIYIDSISRKFCESINSLETDTSTDSNLLLVDFLNKFILEYTYLKDYKYELDFIDIEDELSEYKSLVFDYNKTNISYYLYLIMVNGDTVIEETSKSVKKIKNTLISAIENYDLPPYTVISIFKKKYEEKLINELYNGNLQYKGFADKFSIGVDYFITLKDYLKFGNDLQITDIDSFESSDKQCNYLVLQYISNWDYDVNKEINLFEDERLQNDEIYSYTKFLQSKEFNTSEIKFILNALFLNTIEPDNKRKISNIQQIRYFHFLYLFWVFDYRESIQYKFSEIKDFRFIENFQNKFKNHQQIQRYYLNANNKSHKHYPFASVEKTIYEIENILLIDREKLKPY